MATRYELWDSESGNLIWTYRQMTDALAQVRAYVHDGGEAAMHGLALVRAESDGRGEIIAEDEGLATLATRDGVTTAS